MKIAVTGSAGFIGSHLSTELKRRNHKVVDLVRPNLDNVTSLAERLQGVETVCHCAWMGHPRNESDSQRNIYTSLVVGRAAELAGIKHVVFMSSGGGINSNTAYSNSKREVESLLSKDFGLFNFDLTVLRPTAVYGPGQDPSKGLGAVIVFLDAVLQDKPIHILGSPYSGRDFLHVDDLAECTADILEQKILGTFEVGGPEIVQLSDLILMIEGALSKPAIVQIENPTGVDPQTICLDNTSITEATGWTPTRRVICELYYLIQSLKGAK